MLLKSVFIIAVVAVAMIGVMVPSVFAETRDCSSGSYGDLCKESENVIWDKNKPLVWDDFQGVPGTFPDDHDSTLSADDTGARIFYYIDWYVWWEKSNNIPCEYKITKLDVVAVTSKIESWVYPDRIDGEEDEILKHEQGHFDIAQIHAQEFQTGYEGKDFACPSGIYDDDEIINEINGFWLQIVDDWFAMQKTYDIETDYHEDVEAQVEWNKKIKSLLSTEEYVNETSIPEWIKNNAGWWADGIIDDTAFIQGIQFLIKEGIMEISPTTQSSSSGTNEIPVWIKNNAGWWTDGTINDSTFLSGIEYLVNEGIIVAKTIEEPIEDTPDEVNPISTIEVEIYGDEFSFAAEKYGLFALEYTHPELNGNHKFTIPEYAIGNSIGNFFNSYGLSIDDQCLKFIYGNRSFCSNDVYDLTYFINGNPISNIAYYEIDYGQEIEIKFNANYSNKNLEKELKIQEERIDGAQKRAIEQNKQFSSMENAVQPQMVFNKEVVEMTLYDSKNNKYFWTMPVTTYETQVKIDEFPIMPFKTNTGQIITVGDFRPFVGTSFSNVIDEIYNNLENPDYFVYEIWYMISKLTIYSLDIGEEPRFAIETLVRGGGDCEDTVILIADMLRSSSHTKDWKIKLVYFDSDNLTNPQNINHVVLSIDEGNSKPYIIETTAKTFEDLTMWNNIEIIGWSLDV